VAFFARTVSNQEQQSSLTLFFGSDYNSGPFEISSDALGAARYLRRRGGPAGWRPPAGMRLESVWDVV